MWEQIEQEERSKAKSSPQKGGKNYRRIASTVSTSETKQPLSLEEKKKRTERIEREKPSMTFYRPPRGRNTDSESTSPSPLDQGSEKKEQPKDQPKKQQARGEQGKRDQGKREQTKREPRREQPKKEQIRGEQTKTEQPKKQQTKGEQGKREQGKREQGKREQTKREPRKEQQPKTKGEHEANAELEKHEKIVHEREAERTKREKEIVAEREDAKKQELKRQQEMERIQSDRLKDLDSLTNLLQQQEGNQKDQSPPSFSREILFVLDIETKNGMRPLPVRRGEDEKMMAMAFCRQYGLHGQEDRLIGHIKSVGKMVREKGEKGE